jgi:hypothetical protein
VAVRGGTAQRRARRSAVGRDLDRAIRTRLARLDWEAIGAALDDQGYATTASLLGAAECAEIVGLWADEARFRSRIDMARFRFGVGEYRYFGEPLPPLVAALRRHLYGHLAPIANQWMAALGAPECYPAELSAYLGRCAAEGQRRPTPLLLRYTSGGYNCLHQDLYGSLAFPLQLTCVLSQVGEDYTGGELVLVEQRPRAQSRASTIVLERGDAVIFPNRHRPTTGARGSYRVTVRHGVSTVRDGVRLALGIIFHDAA